MTYQEALIRTDAPEKNLIKKSADFGLVRPRNRSPSRNGPSGVIAASSVAQNREGGEGDRQLDEGRAERQEPDFAFRLSIHGSPNAQRH
jgi:hypothetical protein